MSDPIIGTVGAVLATAESEPIVAAPVEVAVIQPEVAVAEVEVVVEEVPQDVEVEAAPVVKRAARGTAAKKP